MRERASISSSLQHDLHFYQNSSNWMQMNSLENCRQEYTIQIVWKNNCILYEFRINLHFRNLTHERQDRLTVLVYRFKIVYLLRLHTKIEILQTNKTKTKTKQWLCIKEGSVYTVAEQPQWLSCIGGEIFSNFVIILSFVAVTGCKC